MPASVWLQVADAQEYVIRSTIISGRLCMAWRAKAEYLNSCANLVYIHIDPERPDDADPWIDLASHAHLPRSSVQSSSRACCEGGCRGTCSSYGTEASFTLVELKSTQHRHVRGMLMAFESLDDGIARAAKAASDARRNRPSDRPSSCAAASASRAQREPHPRPSLMALNHLTMVSHEPPRRRPTRTEIASGDRPSSCAAARGTQPGEPGKRIKLRWRAVGVSLVAFRRRKQPSRPLPRPPRVAKPSSHQPIIASPPASMPKTRRR